MFMQLQARKNVISERTCTRETDGAPREVNPATNMRVAHQHSTEVSNLTMSTAWTRICASRTSLSVICDHSQNENAHHTKLRSSSSFVDIPNKARAQEVYELPGERIGILKCRCASRNNQLPCSRRVLIEVWWFLFNQFDRNNAKGPNIHRRGALPTCYHFWRGPIWNIIWRV